MNTQTLPESSIECAQAAILAARLRPHSAIAPFLEKKAHELLLAPHDPYLLSETRLLHAKMMEESSGSLNSGA